MYTLREFLHYSEDEEEADYTVDAAVNFLQAQIDKAAKDGKKIRGPYLAQLELSRYLFNRKIPLPDKLGEKIKNNVKGIINTTLLW